jgi:hypothetical protein
MKKLFVPVLWLATLAPFSAQSQQPSGTLAGFLSKQDWSDASAIICLFRSRSTIGAVR